MIMLEIIATEYGSHNNQTYHGYLPEGWAIVPKDVKIPESFPFVEVVVKEIEGKMTVTEMVSREIPEFDPVPDSPIPEREPTADELINIMLGV